MDTNTINQEIARIMHGYNLNLEYTFIPWSQSRNKDEKQPSLNYSVTVKQNGRAILTTLYSMGMGHAPAYKAKWRNKWDKAQAIAVECERGKNTSAIYPDGMIFSGKTPILPNDADVWQSLLSDAEAIDFAGFESWAREYGYDQDSRAAERIYNKCVSIGLKLRAGIDERARVELRELLRDY